MKLACDRLYPCGRCQKSGRASSCVYNSKSLSWDQSVVLSFSVATNEDIVNKAQTLGSFRNFTDGEEHNSSLVGEHVALPAPGNQCEDVVRKLEEQTGLRYAVGDGEQSNLPLINGLVSLVQRQAARIAVLGNELGQRESKHGSINEQELLHSAANINLTKIVPRSFGPLGETIDSANSADTDAMLFVGQGIDTQYYGASNPMSVVSTSHAVLRNVSPAPLSNR
jgi:hypothetical protein